MRPLVLLCEDYYQIALDEAHGFAYVAEFTGGHIQQGA